MALIRTRFVGEPSRQAKGRTIALREERLTEGLDLQLLECKAFFGQDGLDEWSPRVRRIEVQSSRRQRQQEASEEGTLGFIQATVHRHLAKPQIDRDKLFRPAKLRESTVQDSIP